MSTLAEIEAAIENLPITEIEQLTEWLHARLRERTASVPILDQWLQNARGAAMKGVTTASVMAVTRGEE
jgi:hypothetical protein